MKKPQRTTKPPRTPRIKADHHKDDLRVLATSYLPSWPAQ